MDKYRAVLENNRRWAAEKSKEAGFFEQLAAGQNPDFLYIGCSDSRVPANTIMGVEPGDVFVHRNVANLVVNTDLNAHTVIEYAINVLQVDHIVVCGHYGCGGVKAAMEAKDLGILNAWLREIRDVYRLHRGELVAIADQEARYRRLIELNVLEQCTRVMKTASWQRHYLKRRHPTIHGWVFELSDGIIKDLEFPIEEKLKGIQEIYRLDPD